MEQNTGLLGAFTVFLICAIVPIAANIALHRHTMSKFRIALDISLLLVSIAMAVTGTVFVFLPKSKVSK
jgi:multisubunit Na+/H+ antiporter MnhB subunit